MTSQPTKKYKPHRTHQNLNRLKGMNIYKFSNCYVDNNEKERKRPNKGISLRAVPKYSVDCLECIEIFERVKKNYKGNGKVYIIVFCSVVIKPPWSSGLNRLHKHRKIERSSPDTITEKKENF